MGPFIMFWLVGEGIMIYRSVKQYHAPPLPAAILGTSGLFVILAMLAEWQPKLSMMLAAAFDVAAFVNVISNAPTNCTAASTASPGSAKTSSNITKPSTATTTNPGVAAA